MTAVLSSESSRTADRFTRSAGSDGRFMSTSECLEWLSERRDARGFSVERVPFDALDGWTFGEPGGNLVHRSGRFFSVEGLRVQGYPGLVPEWTQPIIVQFEIGILGILVKEFDGVLHCLMQAKMEPGNSNIVQLSPTVQATRSNYLRVHQGRATPYLEYFLAPPRERVLADSLQSEQGGWFLRKRNRNMIVEVTEDIEVLDDYCWLSVGQIQRLLRIDNVVNMDARTVLSCMRFASASGPSLRTLDEVVSWLTTSKADCELVQHRVPLDEVAGWRRDDYEIFHEDGEFFRVVAVDVRAASREVSSWSQPLLAPVAPGLLAFLTREISGVPHILAQARPAPGALDLIEIAPTVHCMPHNYRNADPALRPRYLDRVLGADPLRVRYDAWLSEEGGRFLHAKNRYQVIEVGEEFPVDVPENFCWLTVDQMMLLLRVSNCVNVEARTLLAGLQAVAFS